MNNDKENAKTWNNIAQLYESKFMELAVYDSSYSYFCNLIITTNPVILDIGCGPGNITRYIQRNLPNSNLFGIDLSENMIEIAKKNVPSAHFEVLDARNVEQLNLKFDAISCGFCIPFFTSLETLLFIESLGKITNDNGVIYLSFVDGDNKDSEFKSGSGGNRLFFNYHKSEDLIEAFNKHHFNLMKKFEIPYKNGDQIVDTHTVLIFQKK